MTISVRIVSYFIENLRIQVVRNLKYFIIILLFVLYIETFKCLIERRILKTRENLKKKNAIVAANVRFVLLQIHGVMRPSVEMSPRWKMGRRFHPVTIEKKIVTVLSHKSHPMLAG